MAEALALPCLGKIGGTVLGGIGGCLFDPIKRQFTYMCCFNSNITELETQLEKLETTRQGVQMGVDETRRNVRVVGPTVEAWLTSANEVAMEVEEIIKDKTKVKEGCLNGWCPNLKLRYSLSRKAVKKTKVVVDLQTEGAPYTITQPSYSPPPASLETRTNTDFRGFESRKLKMEEIIKALKHDEINLIGVCGMGGVGKTTMVQEIERRVKEEGLFMEVAMDVVGQEPNLTNVQVRIAEMLGLKNLREKESPKLRADLLRTRLQQDNKKVLVILDDIWKEFDLQAMGIPLECTNKNFKMLYTSRNQYLWGNLETKREISLKLLLEDEAWQLFREKAGNSADAPDLQPIARKLVNECGNLPLALALIGSAVSKKNAIKEIWEGMLDRLTRTSITPANKDLYSRLELSYEFLEDEEAKHLFLLCCLFKEDEKIRIEDLVRYGLGLSFFGGINDIETARRQVFLIVDDLKSRYLLLDAENEEQECVKVHDVVRSMGISIAAKHKFALVSHGAASQWPKMATNEHLIAISLISDEIEELPEGLTYPNLEFLMLRCRKLKEIPPTFFEGMGKLKVLELRGFCGILTLRSLRNLVTLSLEEFRGTLDNISLNGDLLNLEILNLRNSVIRELPEEIGELVNLRVLDMRGSYLLTRIPPGIISRLVHSKELYFFRVGVNILWLRRGELILWEGEGKEEEGRNVNLRELGFLSNLSTLEIGIKLRSNVLIPKDPIFSKLETYKVMIVEENNASGYFQIFYYFQRMHVRRIELASNLIVKCKRVLMVNLSFPIPSNRGGIESLLRSSDFLVLEGEGCNDLMQALRLPDGVDGLRQLRLLSIHSCDTPECFVSTMNQVHPPLAIFPALNVLKLHGLVNLKEICRGLVPAGSFGKLSDIEVTGCERLGYLFQLSVVGCLTQLKLLLIRSCGMMEQVIWKEHQEEDIIHDATNRSIVFPKLEVLKLEKLPSLMGFCREIDQIDFPQLKELGLEDIPQINLIFHNNCNLSPNSKRNNNVGLLSLFPQKVSLPNLEVLEVADLPNLERLGYVPPLLGSLSKLKEFTVCGCNKLVSVFPSQFVLMLRGLERLTVKSCGSLEVVTELEGLDSSGSNPEILPSLKFMVLRHLPKLNYISKRDPAGFRSIQTLKIQECSSLRHVFAPTITKSIPQLRNLEISSCKMLSRIVAEENGLGEPSVDEVEFPQLETLTLHDLPNLLSFFPNVNVNTTMARSTEEYHNPLAFFFNEKVRLKYLVPVGLQCVSDLRGCEFPTNSFLKLKDLQVTGCASLRNSPSKSLSLIGDLYKTTQGLQEVAQILYTKWGDGVLALGSNGNMMLWRWSYIEHNPHWEAPASVQLQPSIGFAMTNDGTGVNLEEAVPCMALSNNDIISACGGKISFFSRDRRTRTYRVSRTSMPPPPASTFLAFHPKNSFLTAIGMEDSTILICDFDLNGVKSKLKGHKMRITSLAFSTNLNILVSSGADAQLCIWRIETWENLNSVPIQLSSGKTCHGDTRVQFHSNQILLLVSHETQLAIYDAAKMDWIYQWVPQDVLPAPISSAAYSCDCQLIYASFCDGNIGVFDADSLMLRHRVVPSIYLPPALLSGSQAVYPKVVATHPEKPNQIAIGLTQGSVILMELKEPEGKWGLSSTVDNSTASSSTTRHHTPIQEKEDKEEINLDADKDVDED